MYDDSDYHQPPPQKVRPVLVTLLFAIAVGAVFYNRVAIVDRLQNFARGGWGSGSQPHYLDTTPRAEQAAARVTPLLKAEMSAVGLRLGDPIYVRIFKETNEVEVWVQLPNSSQYELYKVYRICAWSGELGPKISKGDDQAPEGFYYIAHSNLDPASKHHLALDLGYPNDYDRQHSRDGAGATIHGGCDAKSSYAMTDAAIEELFTLAGATLGAGHEFFRIHCFPFRMTDERMDQVVAEKSKLLDFWANLKEGYDFFEIVGRPPNTRLENGKYVFE